MFLVALPLQLLGLASIVSGISPTIRLGKTTLIGRDVPGFHQDFFGGIPFARPPLGNLRLKPPVLTTTLDVDRFDASNFGKRCLQQTGTLAILSEDCLTINILRPTGTKPNAKLPVLLWIYGGGFKDGGSSDPAYNASLIVSQSIARGTPLIYVNFNYRLGPLGFPQGQESADRGALNLGLKDQLAALKWVQANIGSFGGDKDKVTVFGESAGAMSISILFLNSPIEKLARAAIFESGSPSSSVAFTADRREVDWQNFVSGIPSCASLAVSGNTFDCLRQANTSEVHSGLLHAFQVAPEAFPFAPTFDGPDGLLPSSPSTFVNSGNFAKLPFIAGTNLDEGTVFLPRLPLNSSVISAQLLSFFGPSLIGQEALENAIDHLLELYLDIPSLGSPFNTGDNDFGIPGFKRTAAIFGDLLFQAPRRSWIQAASKRGVKAFGYQFTQPQPNGSPINGVSHGSEVLFVYGSPTDTSTSAQQLSRLMIDYWISFTTSLTPNDGKGLTRPNWPQYTPKNQVLMQLNGANSTTIPDNYRKEQIDYINSNPVVFRQRRGF